MEMKLTDKVETILRGIEKEDSAKAKQMRELLDGVMCIRKNNRIMTMIALTINMALAGVLFATGASIVSLVIILHFILFYACTAMNRREEDKCFDKLKELGFPFESLKEGEE